MTWLCKISLHKWQHVGFSGLLFPSPVEQCERCKHGREIMFTGTLCYTPEEMADAARLAQESSHE